MKTLEKVSRILFACLVIFKVLTVAIPQLGAMFNGDKLSLLCMAAMGFYGFCWADGVKTLRFALMRFASILLILVAVVFMILL